MVTENRGPCWDKQTTYSIRLKSIPLLSESNLENVGNILLSYEEMAQGGLENMPCAIKCHFKADH